MRDAGNNRTCVCGRRNNHLHLVDIPDIIRRTIRDIGYNDSAMGFDWATCAVITSIDKQSPDIAIGVNPEKDCSRNRVRAIRD